MNCIYPSSSSDVGLGYEEIANLKRFALLRYFGTRIGRGIAVDEVGIATIGRYFANFSPMLGYSLVTEELELVFG